MRDLVTGKWHGPDMNSAFKEDKSAQCGAVSPFSNTRERCASDSLRGLIFKIAYYFTVRAVPRGTEKEGYYPAVVKLTGGKLLLFNYKATSANTARTEKFTFRLQRKGIILKGILFRHTPGHWKDKIHTC
jgi:hypothetical protein